MTTPLNRHKAASRARLAQALLGLLVVGGGAALAVGLRAGPRATSPASEKPEIPVVELPNRAVTTKTVALDTGGLAERLSSISNAPKPVEVTPTPTTTNPQQQEVRPQPAELRYLGAVMGSHSMALVSDGGKQRFVAIGDTLAGGSVESISDAEIKIGGNAPRTIELASRSGDVLTKGHAARGGGPAVPAASRPGAPNPGLAVVKQPPQAMQALMSGGGSIGLNGEEIPPIPDYIRPDQQKRYDQIREEQRSRKGAGSEAELAEFAAKLLMTEDPKSATGGGNPQMMDKMPKKGGKP
jgi:hypothetical protein